MIVRDVETGEQREWIVRGEAMPYYYNGRDDALAERIRRFQFRDIRPKAASELPVEHAIRLLGHSEKEITERVYRRLGEIVRTTK